MNTLDESVEIRRGRLERIAQANIAAIREMQRMLIAQKSDSGLPLHREVKHAGD